MVYVWKCVPFQGTSDPSDPVCACVGTRTQDPYPTVCVGTRTHIPLCVCVGART